MPHLKLQFTFVARPTGYDLMANCAPGNRVLMGLDAASHGDKMIVFLLKPKANYKDPVVLLAGMTAMLPRARFPFDWTRKQVAWQWDQFRARKLAIEGMALVDALYELPEATWDVAKNRLQPKDIRLVVSVPLAQPSHELDDAIAWLMNER